MSRYPSREARTSLSPDLIDLLADEENASGLSDLSQSLSSRSDSNADNSDSSTPTVSRHNSIGHIPIPEEDTEIREANLDVPVVLEVPDADVDTEADAPEVLQVPEERVRAMVDTVVLATFDDLTGTEVRLEGQRILCFYCWDGRFYENTAHIKRTADGGKPFICDADGGTNFVLKIRERNEIIF